MNYKKQGLIITIFIILIVQTFLNINNNQKTSFRYFIWKTQEVSIGKLINISFASGFLISLLLNKSISKSSLVTHIKSKKNNDDDEILSEENNSFDDEIPPQRDLRDIQPTVSVNYRVVKSPENIDEDPYNESFNNSKYKDDWINNDSDW